MSVFYNKYRPQKFKEIVGQEHITRTFKNALKTDNMAHAYLFAGPRGTGKTSVARILARAVNCELGKDVEPCGKCDACVAVRKGNFLDLIEIDAASNRGIDDVRALREKINFQPVQGKYKIYVLDEVHMLTKEAFNALLKTLEEPPTHVIFVLCTTEPHRLPATIISRCQRFDFQLANEKLLVNHLEMIVKQEKLKADEAALEVIVERARGSYRDALSLLEQAVNFTSGKITRAEVIKVLGLSLESEADKFLKLLLEGETQQVMEMIKGLVEEGRDLRYFAGLLLSRVRNRLCDLLLSGGNEAEIAQTVKLLDYLQETEKEIRFATLPQIPLEILVLKFVAASRKKSKEDTQPQVAELATVVAGEGKGRAGKSATLSENAPKKNALSDLGETWRRVMEEVQPYNHSVHALLKGCEPKSYEKGVMSLGFAYKFHKERVEESKNRQLVEKVCSEVIGENVRLTCYLHQQVNQPRPSSSNAGYSQSGGQVDVSQVSDSLSEDELIKIAQDILGGEVESES
ncbi:DNA polymerase III subunit gamma/tau [Patescibacteria group bacterium]|nr:DNA polymerase III subunit gamma/tau [Patescibacteria group bacterium]